MVLTIAAEQFHLTDAIREKIETSLTQIQKMLPQSANVRVHLSLTGHREFTALVRTHLRDRDLISVESGPNLYVAISEAASRFKRKISEDRKKRLAARRIPRNGE